MNDTVFLNYLRDSYYHFERNGDHNKVDNYIKDGVIDSSENLDIHLAFGYNSRAEFEKYVTSQDKRVLYLRVTHGIHNLNHDDLRHLFDGGFYQLNLPPDPGYTTLSCESKFRHCRNAANAEAAIMHMGCVAADLSVLGGIICHGAVFVYQYNAVSTCREQYDECRDNI